MGGTLAAAGVIAGSHACRVRRNRCKRSVSSMNNNLSTLYCLFQHARIHMVVVVVVGGGGLTLVENHKNIGYLSKTGLDPLKNNKATKPAFHVEHHRHASETTFIWRFVGGPMMALS